LIGVVMAMRSRLVFDVDCILFENEAPNGVQELVVASALIGYRGRSEIYWPPWTIT
jgi:hypothetical protein